MHSRRSPARYPVVRRNRPRIAHHRLHNHARNLARIRAQTPPPPRPDRYTAAPAYASPSPPERPPTRESPASPPRPRLHQQRIRMAVVAALELDHKLPPGKPARQPDRRHARLRPRAHKPHLLHRRKARPHQLRQIRPRPQCDAPKLAPRPAASRIASTTGGNACPRIIGPHEPNRSTYPFPSASNRYAPSARTTNGGCPPTARNARTGEFTPPGKYPSARRSSSSDSTNGLNPPPASLIPQV